MSNAQNNEDMQQDKTGAIRFARFQMNANSNKEKQNDTLFLKSILSAGEEDSFRKVKDYLEKALAYAGAQKYKWEDEEMEKYAKMNTNNSNATYYLKGELLISEDFLTGSNTTVTSCGDINVQNVKVQNGAKLTLNATGNVNIISDFEVDSGSEVEIK
jgi:hypothetical protein